MFRNGERLKLYHEEAPVGAGLAKLLNRVGAELGVVGSEEREIDDGDGGGELVLDVISGLCERVVGGRDGGDSVRIGEGFDASDVGGVNLGWFGRGNGGCSWRSHGYC